MSNRVKRKSRVALIVSFVLLIVGCGFLTAPIVSNVLFHNEISAQIDEVYQAQNLAEGNRTTTGKDSGQSANSLKASAEELQKMYEYYESYNAQISCGERSALNDPFGQAKADGDFKTNGLDNGLIGVIEIPAMGCELPLYLGASDEHMAQGAAVVAGSSVPLGGASTNSVIAAHRGWKQLPMFRDIERLSVGDAVVLHTLWQDLGYSVIGTRVISPDDLEAVRVREGLDLISLVTCHPYGYNTYRYVVFCVRDNSVISASDREKNTDIFGSEETADKTEGSAIEEILGNPVFEDALRVVGVVVLVSCFCVVAIRVHKS